MTEEEKQEEKQSWDSSGFVVRALGSIREPEGDAQLYATLAVAYQLYAIRATLKRIEKKQE